MRQAREEVRQRPNERKHHGAEREQREIRGDSGQRDDDVAADIVAVIARIHRHRLGRSEHERRMTDDENRRQDDRHHGIDVLQRIQGQAAEHVGRVVTLAVGGFCVGIFVRDDRKQQHGDL